MQRATPLLLPPLRHLLLVLVVLAHGVAIGTFPLGPATVRAAAHAPPRPLSGTDLTFVALAHTAINANTYYNYTVLNEDPIFTNPNAEVFVTASGPPNNACGCVYDTHALMVWNFGNTWDIILKDGTPLSLGTTYNVFATYDHHFHNSPQEASFAHIVITGNSANGWTTLDESSVNYSPYAVIVVTQHWNPGDQGGGVFNVHQVGVWYDGSHWAILNEDRAPIPVGTAFNVYVVSTAAPWAFSQ
ncbi:MAG TPA: hypothetical protein VGP82_17085, partial [Ktedonobacterales bacterium]|nr:hypothetical protein [Ktedonobacterales bacterium]